MDYSTQDAIFAETGNKLVSVLYEEVLNYFNDVFFQTHFGEKYENAAQFATGLLDDLINSNVRNSDKFCEACLDEAYNLFLRMITNLPSFCGIPVTFLHFWTRFHEHLEFLRFFKTS